VGTVFFIFGFSDVTLPNGITVPKQKFIVYLFIGHSNMSGFTKQKDTVTHERAWNFFIDDYNHQYPHHTWVLAKDPIHSDRTDGGGPGMPFLKKMVNDFPGYYFGIVQNANFTFKAVDYLEGQYFFEEIVGAADTIKDDVTLGGIVCMLGMAEIVMEPELVPTFATDVQKMVQGFRNRLDAPNLPFLMGELEDAPWFEQARAENWPVEEMRNQILSIPAMVPNSVLIPSDGITFQDDHHYDSAGHVVWAARAVDLIIENDWLNYDSQIKVDPRKLLFTAFERQEDISPQTVSVTNGSQVVMLPRLFAQSGENWLTVETTGSRNNQIVNNIINIGEMESGEYLTAVRLFGGNLDTVIYEVELTIIGKSNPERIVLSPPGANLIPGDSLQFKASVLDQFGEEMDVELEWEVSGGGSISPLGLFKSNGDEGEFLLTVSIPESDISDTIEIIVEDVFTIDSSKVFTLTYPNGGEIWQIGEEYEINWQADTSLAADAVLEVSPDNGRRWFIIVDESILAENENWGAYTWIIPEEVSNISMIGDTWLMKVRTYIGNYKDVSDGYFEILPPSTSIKTAEPSDVVTIRQLSNYLLIHPKSKGTHKFGIFALNGKDYLEPFRILDGEIQIPTDLLVPGIYLLQIKGFDNCLRFVILK
jgi:hypothetical protein